MARVLTSCCASCVWIPFEREKPKVLKTGALGSGEANGSAAVAAATLAISANLQPHARRYKPITKLMSACTWMGQAFGLQHPPFWCARVL